MVSKIDFPTRQVKEEKMKKPRNNNRAAGVRDFHYTFTSRLFTTKNLSHLYLNNLHSLSVHGQ